MYRLINAYIVKYQRDYYDRKRWKKSQSTAQVIGWLSLPAGVVMGTRFLTNSTTRDDLMGILYLAGGFVLFLSCWGLYALGQIAENIHAIREKITPKTEEATVQSAGDQT